MNKYALIIGIGNYPSESGLINVDFAENDAIEMAHYARRAGFKLIGDEPIINNYAKSDYIIDLLNSMFHLVKPNDFVLIYYAGHGCYTENDNYLIPYDHKIKTGIDESNHITFDSIDEHLRDTKLSKFVLFIDTYHGSRAGTRIELSDVVQNDSRDINEKGKLSVLGHPINHMGQAEEQEPSSGRTIFASSCPYDGSREMKEFKHGLFTHFLLKGLEGKSDQSEISIDELIRFTKDNITHYSELHKLNQNRVIYTNLQGIFSIPTLKTSGDMEDAKVETSSIIPEKSKPVVEKPWGVFYTILNILGIIASIASFILSLPEKQWGIAVAAAMLLFLIIITLFFRSSPLPLPKSNIGKSVLLIIGILLLVLSIPILSERQLIAQWGPFLVTFPNAGNSNKTNLVIVKFGTKMEKIESIDIRDRRIRNVGIEVKAGMWSSNGNGEIRIIFKSHGPFYIQTFIIPIKHKIPNDSPNNYQNPGLMKKYEETKSFDCPNPLDNVSLIVYPGFSMSIGSINAYCYYRISLAERILDLFK